MPQVTKTHGTNFDVPSNVTTVRVLLRGEPGEGAEGGEGGVVEGDLGVSPGDVLYIRGTDTGGLGPGQAGDGGDCIDVRPNSVAEADQAAVAGGGGGEGEDNATPNPAGGDGGAETGEAGDSGGGDADGGGGGSQTAGGSPNGTRGAGGDGEDGVDRDGGGGGGGYFGGGGGLVDASRDSAGAGGGGSNYTGGLAAVYTNQRGGWASTAEAVITWAETPSVTIDAITETGETDVRVQASNANTYDSTGEWRVERNGTLIHTETADSDLDFTDSDAVGGVANSYTVTRTNVSAADSASASIDVRLEAVTGLSISGASESSISTTWDPVENADAYEVLRATASGAGYADYTQIGTTSTNTFTDDTVTSGTEYFYTVQPVVNGTAAFDGRYPGEVSATANLLAPAVVETIDTSQTQVDVVAARNDANDSGDLVIIVDGADYATVSYDYFEQNDSYGITGFAEATPVDVAVRRETSAASATSSTVTQYTKPAAPGPLSVTTDELEATHTLSWADNSTGEDGYDVLEARNGGTQTAIATDLAVDTTTYTTDRQDRVSAYEYQVRAFVGSGSTRAESLSEAVTAGFPSYANYWAVVEETDGTTTLLTDTIESGPAYEHTALHGFTHTLRNSDVPFSDWGPLTEIEVFLDDERLFFGELIDLDEDAPSEGVTTVDAHGPAEALTRAGPSSKVTYENVLVYQALEDYLENEVTSVDVADWTVFAPPGEIQADDTLVLSDSFSGFATIAPNVADDEPVDNNGTIALQQAAFVGVTDDFADVAASDFVEGDDFTDGSAPWHIDATYANIASTGDTVAIDVTPDHDIPADRVGVAIHGDAVDTAVSIKDGYPFSFNGVEIDTLPFLNDGDRWSIYPEAYGDSGGADLSVGSTYRLELTLNGAEAEYNIDALAVYDTRYGPFTFGNPTTLGEKISGPRPYKPVTIALADEARAFTISEARVAATAADTSNAFEWDFTTTGGASSLTAETADATFDFFGGAQYGTTLAPSVTLDGYGSNSWLADGANPQELTSLDISLTTVDIASLASIELTKSHFRNLQRLHEAAGMRWVIDPTVDRRVDGIVAESFAPDSTAAERAATWTQLDVSRRRQMEGYANAVTVVYIDANGDDQTFVGAPDSAEVSRVDEEVRKTVFAPNVATNDQARNAMLNERRERIARDRLSGTVRAAAEPLLPGYRYDVDAFGGPTSLTRTQYVEAADNIEMALDFELDDDVLRRVLETQDTVDTIQERL